MHFKNDFTNTFTIVSSKFIRNFHSNLNREKPIFDVYFPGFKGKLHMNCSSTIMQEHGTYLFGKY